MKHLRNFRLCLLACLFAASQPALAFQVADGAPPSQTISGKYIFYWGQHQCTLSEADGYEATLTLSAVEFRQLLITVPKVWNGSGLVENLRFKLEGTSVSADNYLGQLAQLDAQLSPKIKPGKPLHLTELTLEEGVLGNIDFNLQATENEDDKKQGGKTLHQPANFLNRYFLEQAVWGREDIYEISNRDFFTVGEFWQSIRQEPAVTWLPYIKPQILRSDVNFTSKDKATFSVVARLENNDYRGMLDNLENYRYMVHPGATVTLQLQTAEQYDLLYKNTLRIVADDDPRLRLRRKRDQHSLSIRWGYWSANLDDLYLLQLTNQTGDSLETDLAIEQNTAWSFPDDYGDNWGKEKPECRVDGDLVSGDISFRVTVADSLVLYVNSNNYDADAVIQFFSQKDFSLDRVTIDSIQVNGYNLPPITVSFFVMKQNKRQ